MGSVTTLLKLRLPDGKIRLSNMLDCGCYTMGREVLVIKFGKLVTKYRMGKNSLSVVFIHIDFERHRKFCDGQLFLTVISFHVMQTFRYEIT